jgi:hypothetical protein
LWWAAGQQVIKIISLAYKILDLSQLCTTHTTEKKLVLSESKFTFKSIKFERPYTEI